MIYIIIFGILVFLVVMDAIIAAIIYRVLMHPAGKNVFGDRTQENIEPNFNYEELNITTENNISLHAFWIKNSNSNELIILLHGYGSKSSNLMPYISHLQSEGYNILVPDLRGHGKSSGSCGLGYGDAKDIRLWLKYLETQTSVPYNTILFGTSMGATTAINTALNSDKRFTAVVADSPAPDFYALIKKVYGWKIRYPWFLVHPFIIMYIRIFRKISRKQLSLYDRIDQLDTPFLLIHGSKDGLINIKSALKLYELIKCTKDILLTESDHIGSMKLSPLEYWDKVDGFIRCSLNNKEII